MELRKFVALKRIDGTLPAEWFCRASFSPNPTGACDEKLVDHEDGHHHDDGRGLLQKFENCADDKTR